MADESPKEGKPIPILQVSPGIVPEESWNKEVLKMYKDSSSKTMPGTTYQSHPYWKNR